MSSARAGRRRAAREDGALRTRRSITNAAQEVFEKQGWSGATIHSIAQRAGVSQSSVEALFKTKPASDPQVAVCSLQGTVVTEPVRLSSGDAADTANMPIMGTVTLSNPGTITINCGGFNIGTDFKRMLVTKVTSVVNG